MSYIMYIISMIYRCRIIVNDGQPTTFLPATVKQLFQIGVGKLSSREYQELVNYVILQ